MRSHPSLSFLGVRTSLFTIRFAELFYKFRLVPLSAMGSGTTTASMGQEHIRLKRQKNTASLWQHQGPTQGRRDLRWDLGRILGSCASTRGGLARHRSDGRNKGPQAAGTRADVTPALSTFPAKLVRGVSPSPAQVSALGTITKRKKGKNFKYKVVGEMAQVSALARTGSCHRVPWAPRDLHRKA